MGEAVIDFKSENSIVWIHEPTGWRTKTRYKFVNGEDIIFPMIKISTKDSVKFIQLADAETSNLTPIIAEVKSLAHSLDVDFIFASGDLARISGMREHADKLNEEKMLKEVVYTVGNHDIVTPDKDGTTYQTLFGPYWYSFERSNLIFIAMPMDYGDVKLPYKMTEFGDWLIQILEFLPKDKKIVLIGHHLLGRQLPPIIMSSSGKAVDLGDRIAGVFFGHWHLNAAIHDPNTGAMALGTAQPNKAGLDHDLATIRFVEISSDGAISSNLIWSGYNEKTQNYKLIESLPPSEEEVFTLYNSTAHNGYFPDLKVESLSPAWVAKLPDFIDENAIFWNSTPLLINNSLYVGVTDDAEGRNGGIAKFNAANGEFEQFYRSGYSIKNTLFYNDSTIYGNDTRGNIFAIDADNLSLKWLVPAVSGGIPPINNGVAFADGVLYAGWSYDLKAITKNGEVIWRNTHWRGSHSFAGTITLADNLVISSSNFRGFYANSKTDGSLIWQRKERPTNYTSATAVFADDLIWIKGQLAVHAVEPSRGKDVHKYELKKDIQAAAPVVVLADKIVVPSSNDGIFAIDRNSGEVIWNFNKLNVGLIDTIPYRRGYKTIEAPISVTSNTVWFAALDGFLYGVDLANGQLRQKINLEAPAVAAPLVLKDRVYVVTFGRNIHAFKVNRSY